MEQFHKRVVKIEAFEQMIAELAIEKKYDTVICGHIHQPRKKTVETERGRVTYLNSGDWVEHMTSLEFYDNDWHLFQFEESELKVEKVKAGRVQTEVLTDEIAMYWHTLSYGKMSE
jgi:predicted phosphodiesterase